MYRTAPSLAKAAADATNHPELSRRGLFLSLGLIIVARGLDRTAPARPPHEFVVLDSWVLASSDIA